MTDLDRLASWLRCPVCGGDLGPVDRLVLGCSSGHRHDVNKRGYISLLGGGSKLVGDSAAMLDARDAVLESGLYTSIADAVTSAVPSSAERILDAGAGTGHYLRAALRAHPAATGLAMDLSPAAVGRAARSSDRIDGLVADTWRPLPVRDAVADAVLDVFAPRNLPEFRRVLSGSGRLIVVVPRAAHLASVRAATSMLDVPADKAEDVITAAEPLYALLSREHVVRDIAVDPALRAALVGMGPSAHHVSADGDGSGTAQPDAPAETRLDVDVLAFAPR